MARQLAANDRWGQADPYERYVGRWSRLVAKEFVHWLAVRPGAVWVDVGCGTGALTQVVLHECNPKSVYAVDKSPGFVASASAGVMDPRAQFAVADASGLPVADASCDAAVSGLVLNFVAQPSAMVAEMKRATLSGGQVAAYVWDYAGGMQMLRLFWDAAVAVCGAADVPHEGARFPVCAPEPLRLLWTEAGLLDIEVDAIEIPTRFSDFDDYWQPFLGGQGPAPTWLAQITPQRREAIRAKLERELPSSADGIQLSASAWAIKGRRA